MDFIANILNQGLAYIIPMIVLLGLLIFVHELGHFLAAKYYKVRVETFSLGFGPKILKFTRGGTVYCISALPLGGYVKMFGDEPGKDIPIEKQRESYLHKPVGQRIVIALAGPLMNLFFAGFLFYAIAHIGDKALSPVVGEIPLNSQAYEVGFRPYDTIKSINNNPIKTWNDVEKIVENSGDTQIRIELERLGQVQNLQVTPKLSLNDNIFSTADKVGKIKGLDSKLHLPVVGVVYESPIYNSGLRNGDRIVEIDGQQVQWFKDIEPMILESLYSGNGKSEVKVHRFKDFRESKKFDELTLHLSGLNHTSQKIGIFVPQTLIAEVQEDSPAAKIGLQRFDKIQKINGNTILSFADIVKNVSSYSPETGDLKIEILRENQTQEFSVAPNMNSLEGRYGETENRYTIGVIPLLFAVPQTFVWKSSSISEALSRSIQQTWHWTKVTLLSFVRIVQNRVTSKNIGGIISIGQVAQQSWNIGLNAFLKMMAIISINLFILNLLPIPILDGGHLLLFTLEAIKGAPISLKKIEVAQQVGFFIILFLMAFALFNDFSRIFGS